MQREPQNRRRAPSDARGRAHTKQRAPLLFYIVPALALMVATCVAVAIFVAGNPGEVEAETLSGTAEAVTAASPTPVTTEVPENGAVEIDISDPDYAVSTRTANATTVAPPTVHTTSEITAEHVETQLEALREYFADGKYWNHIDVDTDGMSDEEKAMVVTDTPCTHVINGYGYCNVYLGGMADTFPQYDYETQCLGFANLMSDLLFGVDAPVTAFYDFDDLRIGDQIRLASTEHSMIVVSINEAAGSVEVVEVNADYENCEIEWGRVVTEDELYATDYNVVFYTRYE